MPMQPSSHEVPQQTCEVAHRAFPNGHPYLRMRDELGPLFDNDAFAALFSARGRPATAPARLALICVLQFAEGLSDRQAADAVRSRLDWKYLLSLELTDPGFDHTVLVEFRERLLTGGAEAVLFTQLLERARTQGWLKAGGKQRTDATHVLAAVRGRNRLEAVGETMRHALNTLAVAAPTWLLAHLDAEWPNRYGRSFEETRLPGSDQERQALAEAIGADGFRLLTEVQREASEGTEWAWLREVPAVEILRQVWVQQFYREEPAVEGGQATLRWRREDEIPPASQAINSPYDAEARWGRKGGLGWMGYKVHLTETCDPDAPHLITDVQTTRATTADTEVLPVIQAALAERNLLPATQIVDGGYVDAPLLVESRSRGVDLCGPTRGNSRWQAQEGGFIPSDFEIDWDARHAICPGGRVSRRWNEGEDQWQNAVVRIGFARTDCHACALRTQCTRSKANGRILTVRPQDQHEALMRARERQTTEAFREQYALRAGVEGTISQGVRRCDLRQCRYVGATKAYLQHLITAAAINFTRMAAWLMDWPLSRTRQSALVRLAPQPS